MLLYKVVRVSGHFKYQRKYDHNLFSCQSIFECTQVGWIATPPNALGINLFTTYTSNFPPELRP
jgi:hypothetical protein